MRYLAGVASLLLRYTRSMVSGMSVMKMSASALAPGTASVSRSSHSLLVSTHVLYSSVDTASTSGYSLGR